MNLQNFLSDVLTNGGASFNITTGVYNPNKGFFVSVPNREVQKEVSLFNYEDILAFIRENVQILCNESYFLGGWVENGIVYLDVSEQIFDKRIALTQGINRNQLAIFDASNSSVINLPTRQTSGTLTQQRAYITQAVDNLMQL